MKFCASCGHKVGPSDRFCSNCGLNLSQMNDNDSLKKSDLKVKNMISDTKKAVEKTKRRVKKLLLPTLSVVIVGGVAFVAYNIIQDKEQEQQTVRNQAVEEQEDKQRVIKLEKCALEHFANAHGNSDKVWGYLKIMCSLRNTEVEKYQKEWGKNLELLKEKREAETLLVK